MQSRFGRFGGRFVPETLVAWLADRSGGWQWTWAATGACSLIGLLLARQIAVLLQRRATAGGLADNRRSPGP